MLVSLTLNNYRSYRDNAEFSMRALDSTYNSESVTSVQLEDGSTIRLLNVAALFGANAAGKSNIIYALHDISQMVRESLNYTQTTKPDLFWPYAFDQRSLNRPTEATLEFIVNRRLYSYTLQIDKNSIVLEKLQIKVGKENIVVFERKRTAPNGDYSLHIDNGWHGNQVDLLDSDLLSNQLLLSKLATKQANGLQDVADYIANLLVTSANDYPTSGQIYSKMYEQYLSDNVNKVRFKKFLHIADLGVDDFYFKRHDDSEFRLPDSIPNEVRNQFISENRWEFALQHKTSSMVNKLPIELESEGTKSLIRLIPQLLYALDKGLPVIYDEFNSEIHPALNRLIIDLFQNRKSNPKGAQLILTSQDPSIADHNTLRADQIWFVEKKEGVSELYSAQDFTDVSINTPFESWYRSGRFGALPKFGTIEYIFSNNL